jgi:putative inorganic carbon (hco3(-)) transporter
LFIRPSELFEGFEEAKLYEAAIVLATIAAVGPLLGVLSPTRLRSQPLLVFALGLLAAVVLSHLANGNTFAARESGVKFAKVFLYYLLVVVNLDTPLRFRLFLLAVGGMMMVQVGLGLAQYFGVANLPAFAAYAQKEYNPATGEMTILPRLCGCGIFNDPNDLCVMLVIGTVICLYVLTESRLGPIRFTAVAPLAVFVTAVPLTHSRGGLLALLAAFASLAVSAVGVRRGLLLLLAGLPVLLVAVGGRMTRFEIDNADDTSQHRIRAWSDGLSQIRAHPLFGTGHGTYPDIAGLVAHNSYVEAFTELGFVGGYCFVSLFALGVWTLRRLGQEDGFSQVGSLSRFRPFGLAMLVSLAAGLYSLSRIDVQPPYTVFGIVTAYFGLIDERLPDVIPPLTLKLVSALAGVALATLIGLYVFVNMMVRWS